MHCRSQELLYSEVVVNEKYFVQQSCFSKRTSGLTNIRRKNFQEMDPCFWFSHCSSIFWKAAEERYSGACRISVLSSGRASHL